MDVVTLNHLLDKELLNNPWKIPSISMFDDELFEELLGVSSETLGEDLNGYLQREEYILSLVREKQKKRMKNVSKQSLFQIFKNDIRGKRYVSNDKCYEYLMDMVGKAFVKPELEKLAVEIHDRESSEGWEKTARKRLEGILGPVLSDIVLDTQLTGLESSILKSYSKTGGRSAEGLGLTNRFGKRVCLCLNGWMNAKKRDTVYTWSHKKSDEYAKATDFHGLAEMVFIQMLDQMFQTRIQGMSEDERMEDVVYRTMLNDVTSELWYTMAQDKKILIGEKAAYGEFLTFLEGKGYEYRISDSLAYGESITDKFQIWNLAVCAPFLPGLPRFRYAYDDGSDDMSHYHNRIGIIYMKLFFLLYDEYINEMEDEKFQIEQKSAARVFQTKKNIPEKYLRVMKSSLYNDTFGYVELDEECDLNRFREIEKEFLALKKLCFGDEQDYKDVALRFRKLGRHHAAGLYFPTLLCLCVDIRYPSSFGHEYLHMVDFEHGELSRGYAFLGIRERYSELLMSAVAQLPEDDPTKKVMKGKGKYNLDYYLRPTETFARCGEIYFTCIHKVQNSLMEPKFGIEYPRDDKILMELIEDYYSKVFPISAELHI